MYGDLLSLAACTQPKWLNQVVSLDFCWSVYSSTTLFFLDLSNYLCFLLTAGELTKNKRLELVKTLKGQEPQEDPSNQGENLALEC